MADDKPILAFTSQRRWESWLKANHLKSSGIWLRFAKKGSGLKSVTYAEAVESALCYGWIDGQALKDTDTTYLQKFTPRAKRSMWSKINRQKALVLIENGRMQPAGLAEIERAKLSGRWESAYDSWATMTVPQDLQSALDANPAAKAFFETLTSRNRYAILFRLHSAKKTETRERRLQQYIDMLERQQKLH